MNGLSINKSVRIVSYVDGFGRANLKNFSRHDKAEMYRDYLQPGQPIAETRMGHRPTLKEAWAKHGCGQKKKCRVAAIKYTSDFQLIPFH
jgi:transposase-like protein